MSLFYRIAYLIGLTPWERAGTDPASAGKIAEREVVGREVSAVTITRVTMVMLAWPPGKRGAASAGASREDLEKAFAGWTVTDEEAADVSGPNVPTPVKRAAPRWLRLRRDEWMQCLNRRRKQ